MISAKFYVFFFISILLAVPAFISFLFEAMGFSNLYCGLTLLNVLILIFVGVYNSSAQLSFTKGLEIICNANMSGCANLTMIYLIPLLFIVYFAALGNALAGIVKGKKYAERKWVNEVSKHEALGGLHW